MNCRPISWSIMSIRHLNDRWRGVIRSRIESRGLANCQVTIKELVDKSEFCRKVQEMQANILIGWICLRTKRIHCRYFDFIMCIYHKARSIPGKLYGFHNQE